MPLLSSACANSMSTTAALTSRLSGIEERCQLGHLFVNPFVSDPMSRCDWESTTDRSRKRRLPSSSPCACDCAVRKLLVYTIMPCVSYQYCPKPHGTGSTCSTCSTDMPSRMTLPLFCPGRTYSESKLDLNTRLHVLACIHPQAMQPYRQPGPERAHGLERYCRAARSKRQGGSAIRPRVVFTLCKCQSISAWHTSTFLVNVSVFGWG